MMPLSLRNSVALRVTYHTTKSTGLTRNILKSKNARNNVIDFIPYGYDERQYCSPGINLSAGCFSRTPYGQYDQYHTSADNLDYMEASSLEEAFITVKVILQILEGNKTYINVSPKCEPQVGKHGLYRIKGGNNDAKEFQMA